MNERKNETSTGDSIGFFFFYAVTLVCFQKVGTGRKSSISLSFFFSLSIYLFLSLFISRVSLPPSLSLSSVLAAAAAEQSKV